MALSVKTGAFNIGTGAGGTTVAVSGVGFQPKALIFWWSGRTESANAAGAMTHLRGMGFAVSSSSFRAVATRDEDALGTSNAECTQTDLACVLEMGAGAMAGYADLQSLDSDGFTLEIQDQFTTDLRVSYIAYGGDDITNAEIGTFTAAGTAPTNQTVNNSGNFQPDITFLLGAQVNTDATFPMTIDADSTIVFGAATDSGDEHVLMAGANDAAGTGATATYCRSGEIYAAHGTNPTLAPTNRAEFVSHNASPGGFTINWLARATALRIFYLSIKGGQWHVGNVTTSTGTSNFSETGVGFQPAALLFASGSKAETAAGAVPDVHDLWSIGAATSASERTAQATASRDGNTNMNVSAALRTDAVYAQLDPVTDAIVGLMDLVSMDSDGFTAVMDDADPSAAFVWYVAAASAAVSGRTGELALTLDDATVSATGTLAIAGSASITLADATLAATGTLALTGTASVTLDAVSCSGTGTLALTGQASVTLADATLSAAGALAITGTAAITLANATLVAEGTIEDASEDRTGSASITLADATLAATGQLAIAGQAAITLADATLAAAGTLPIVGQAAISLAAATLAATGTLALRGTLNLTLADATLSAAGALDLGAVETPASRTWVIPHESRTWEIPYESRTWQVPYEPRTWSTE